MKKRKVYVSNPRPAFRDLTKRERTFFRLPSDRPPTARWSGEVEVVVIYDLVPGFPAIDRAIRKAARGLSEGGSGAGCDGKRDLSFYARLDRALAFTRRLVKLVERKELPHLSAVLCADVQMRSSIAIGCGHRKCQGKRG